MSERSMNMKPGMAAAAAASASMPDVDHEKIARLAYAYWEARGCPDGSAEEDWLRAEQELLAQTSQAAA